MSADPETPGFADTGHAKAPILGVCGMGFEARILRHHGVPVVWGMGGAQLEEQIKKALRHDCSGIVSFGTAGALEPGLNPGSWVVADQVVSGDHIYRCDPPWTARIAARLPGVRRGRLVSVSRAVSDAAGKARLHQTSGAVAVDMESHRVGRIACEHDLPFAVCRVVIDASDLTLPSSVVMGLRTDGNFAPAAFLAELFRHPAQLIELWGLARNASSARSAMARGLDRLGARFADGP